MLNRLLIAGMFVVTLAFGYSQFRTPSPVERGGLLYNTYCVSCHGIKGIGERPYDIYARDEYGFVAPPLDDTGHAWHHTDEQLTRTILEGSGRNPRMIAWRVFYPRKTQGT